MAKLSWALDLRLILSIEKSDANPDDSREEKKYTLSKINVSWDKEISTWAFADSGLFQEIRLRL